MKKFDTVLFDFDGTIMNTNEVILRSWQHTFQTIEHRDEDVAKIIKTFGEPLEVTMKKFFPDVPVDEAVEIYRSYHRDNFGDLITVFPGMKKLLRQVKERGEKTGLVTSRLAYTTQQGLEKYDLKDYFDVVVTAEDTKKHKPDPEPVNIALAKLDSRPEHSLMLGDTMFDILCAKNASGGDPLGAEGRVRKPSGCCKGFCRCGQRRGVGGGSFAGSMRYYRGAYFR